MKVHHRLFKLVPISFLYRIIWRGTCFIIFGLTFTSPKTISWSDRPGRTDILSTRVGFVIRKRSRMFDLAWARSPFVPVGSHRRLHDSRVKIRMAEVRLKCLSRLVNFGKVKIPKNTNGRV